MLTWPGQTSAHLLERWGQPLAIYQPTEGKLIWEYRKSWTNAVPMMLPSTTVHNGSMNAYGPRGAAFGTYTGTSTQMVPAGTIGIHNWCTTRFTIQNDRVLEVNWEGNACEA